jgi:IclR family pca regulon transcriptional regulator
LLPVAISQPASPADRRHSLQTLERGLDVIQVFSRERPALTLSEVAQLAGITRASARRILLTLQMLGHMRSDGRSFSPTPRLLSLGWAYLSSLSFTETAGLLLEELSDEVNEACSAATLDLPDAVFVARVPTRRVVSINLDVGSRVPATHSSMGRVLLAGLPPEQAAEFVRSQQLVKHTDHAIVDHDALIREIELTHQQGWSIVDQELEIGLRSMAAPIRRGDGRVIAAVNISAVSARVTVEEMRTQMLPALLTTADAISRAVVQQNTSRLGNPSRP